MVKYFFILMFLLLCFKSYSQRKLTTNSIKASKHYYKAVNYYRSGDGKLALAEIEKSKKYDSSFVELWLLKGDIYHIQKDTIEEIKAYKTAVSISPDFFPNVHFNLGELLFAIEKYEEALVFYKNFLEYPSINIKKRKRSEKAVRDCSYIIEHANDKNKVDFFPLDDVNTKDDEYWPFVSASGKEFFFTRKSGKGRFENENIFRGEKVEGGESVLKDGVEKSKRKISETYSPEKSVSEKKSELDEKLNFDLDYTDKRKSSWTDIVPFNFNTSSNEGNISMTADGNYIYFGACDRYDGYGSFDIYLSIKQGDGWSEPINVGKPLNSAAWESQPSISPDGKTLYFASNRKGGKGMSDIWVAKLIKTFKDGRQVWSEPESLSFNTTDYDMAPFVHFDNSTLFFSSKGLPGMGGLDIYKVRKKDDGWGKPVNIGVNNKYDNVGFAVSPDGTTAYFSSVTKRGDRDIYYFNLPKHIRIAPIIYLYGNIKDKFSKKPVGARMQLTKYSSVDKIESVYDNYVGDNYSICLPCKEIFCLNVVAKGYQFYSEKISLSDSLRFTSIKKNVLLTPISLDSKVSLANIYFDYDSFKLKRGSFPELHKLKEYLKLNNTIRIEIGGHTDDRGSDEYNNDLSKKRAGEVYRFLIENGISEERLRYKGYGSTMPIDIAKTEKARKINRRTEIKIIKID